jgi:DNA-directed RNA polymerase subunit E'/Rpb7
MKGDYFSTIVLTVNVNIKVNSLKGDINKLLVDTIKRRYEGVCNKDGYILKHSIDLLERSVGEIKTINSESLLNYNITYKADIISPSIDNEYECYVETKNKVGIIAYLKIHDDDLMKDSPFIIIIPKEYIDEADYSTITVGDKLTVKVKSFRIKYLAKHIQVIGTLV